MKHFDLRSFLIGILTCSTLVLLLGASYDVFSQEQVRKLQILANYLDGDGNLNLGRQKIIMQGSSIYDDGSQGGGLILRGGSNRVHVHGDAYLYDQPRFQRETVDINANLNMGTRSIIMQGSRIYDDSSQGGGLILRGGANRVHVHGVALLYDNPSFQHNPVDINASLNMGRNAIIMQGSSIQDDGSQGGGLLLRGGANQIHFFGRQIPH
jgi:hypothetical protein